MTPQPPDDEEIASVEEFQAALGRLMTAAREGDIDPHGSWVYREDDGTRDVEVMVVELDDREASD